MQHVNDIQMCGDSVTLVAQTSYLLVLTECQFCVFKCVVMLDNFLNAQD